MAGAGGACEASLRARLLTAVLFGSLAGLAGIGPAQAQDAAALKARHADLREELASNPFQRPLYFESSESGGALKGDIFAEIAQPYAVVGPALQGIDAWCDILILHQNVKSCRAPEPGAGDVLTLGVGRKFDQPLADAHLIEFRYQRLRASSEYLQLALQADKGPLGTRDYRVLVEVVALDAARSFLHLSYSYAYGIAARMALQSYLATLGRDKVGFSIVERTPAGQPVYIGGQRGVIERNTMRYYLAIEAYLGALTTPPAQQVEKRLNDWYAGVERYPRQLHELEREVYLDMKRKEIRRQQATAGGASVAPSAH